MSNTFDNAVGKWRDILIRLDVPADLLTGRHTPCPLCGGKDRFRFDNLEGKGTYYCSNCGAGNGMKLAMNFTGLSFKETADKIDRMIGTIKAEPIVKPKSIPMDYLSRIGRQLQLVTEGDPVSRYLNGRGLQVPRAHIKLHPNLAYYDNKQMLGTYPAMVAAFRTPESRVMTLHVTYLTADGKKADVPSPRKVLSAMEKGGAVHLCEPAEIMGIAEGIETAIGARMLTGIPTWSAVSANMLAEFQPPAVCKKLVVFADNDANFTGQMYAYRLANRLHGQVEVSVRVPDGLGDWADVQEERRAG